MVMMVDGDSVMTFEDIRSDFCRKLFDPRTVSPFQYSKYMEGGRGWRTWWDSPSHKS